ncbi:hypothetical protein BJ165DRAFT_340808 [Panaeolus papilionaceus]|nr:hypothetical protein BJ165DRAFT_340808 [Panaeolus papilionaceus]
MLTLVFTRRLSVFRILYHTPINNPRLPGSQRQVLRTFEALAGPKSAGNITVISTMWDLIWNENTRRRAEGNFSQLQDEIWKNYIAEGTDIVKFHNTPESAITILDDAYGRGGWFGQFSIQESEHLPLRETRFASHIYDDLQTRIGNLQIQQASIQSELQMVTGATGEQSNEELEPILIAQLKEVQTLITKFKEELCELGTPADRLVTLEPVLPTDNTAALSRPRTHRITNPRTSHLDTSCKITKGWNIHRGNQRIKMVAKQAFEARSFRLSHHY